MSQKGPKSPKRAVQGVTSNEELVRLWIFDGELPDTEGYKRLWELEKAQNEVRERELARVRTWYEAYIEYLRRRGLARRLSDWWRGLP